MNELLLQYLWYHKLFTTLDFKDIDGEKLQVIDFGKWNTNAGPDFSLGKISYRGITLAGPIELHVRASDWYFHHHDTDANYQNIILHVVYENDMQIPEFAAKGIPTLELKNYISPDSIRKYSRLSQHKGFVPCEEIFSPSAVPFQFEENRMLEKLNEKSIEIEQMLSRYKNDYEAVFFYRLAYAFGLKINAEIFQSIASSVDFSIFQKNRQQAEKVEVLLLGLANLLTDPPDQTTVRWRKEFEFLKNKYNFAESAWRPLFSRLRPPNFPTIRLSQLAHLFSAHPALFAEVNQAPDISALRAVFSGVSAGVYWDTHYTPGASSADVQKKRITGDFADLLILNAVLPMRYTYRKNREEDAAEDVLQLLGQIAAEKNSVLQRWEQLGIRCSTALQSQAWLYQYKNYCTKHRCLQCSIALKLLKN